MRNSRYILLLVSIVFLSNCAAHKVDFINNEYKTEQEQVAKRLEAILSAAENKNVDQLENYHLYHSKFTKYDDWEPLKRQNAETAKKAEREGFQALDAFNSKVEDLKVDVLGNTAIATFTLDYSVKMGKDTVSTKARSTIVFVKQGESDWKIIHEHFSPFKANP